MDKEKIKSLRDFVIVALGVIALSYLFVTRLFNIALPFFLSWGVAFCVRPISRKISTRVKISDRIISLLLNPWGLYYALSYPRMQPRFLPSPPTQQPR